MANTEYLWVLVVMTLVGLPVVAFVFYVGHILQEWSGWIQRNKKRLLAIGGGHFALAILNWTFNYPIYLGTLYLVGLVWGLVILTIVSFVINMILLWVYERGKVDWIGFSFLTELEHTSKKKWYQRLVIWAHTRSQALVFILLSVYWDPFVAVAYIHRGEFVDSKRARNMKLVALSTLIGNLWWTARQGILLNVAIWLWQHGREYFFA